MTKRFEGTVPGRQDAELFYQKWITPNSRGTILITHGLAEHSDCYDQLAHELNTDGWNVYGWDLRGHGRSSGKRGYVENFLYFIEDLKHVVSFVQRQEDFNVKHPLILFGHSMGGQIVTRAVLKENLMVQAVVLSSPAMGLKMAVPQWKVALSETAVKWFPKVTLSNEIEFSDLSRDENMIDSFKRDSLRHSKISPEVFLGMRAGFHEVLENAENFKLPLCVQIGGADPMIDVEATKTFFAKTTSTIKELFVYPDSLHEIYNDLDRDQVIKDLKTFLTKV